MQELLQRPAAAAAAVEEVELFEKLQAQVRAQGMVQLQVLVSSWVPMPVL